MIVLYFIIAFTATTVGALSGIGGGVIIKPALDALGDFSADDINVLSSVTVFVMALISVMKQLLQKAAIDLKIAAPLAIGSLIGGDIGQRILVGIMKAFHANHFVMIVQNALLALIILIVFFYMMRGEARFTLGFQEISPVLLTGIILGIVSSFLGIGGGPVNVALIVFVCSCDIKTAAVYSIITILFTQASKLAFILLTGALSSHDLSILPAMITGAVIGGWIGSNINKKVSREKVEKAFNIVQIFVFFICLFNIFCRTNV